MRLDDVLIPVIETERLRLREHRAGDFEDDVAMWADPLVVRHISGKPSTETETWARILCYRGLWTLLGFGYWAVEERASGKFVGDVGFADFKRSFEPSIRGLPEIGWVLASQMHGKGYATEAARAALAWGDAHFNTRTVCLIAPENAGSIRVAEKCGYREIARPTFKGEPAILLAREPAAAAKP